MEDNVTFESIVSSIKKSLILDEYNEFIIDIFLASALSIELERPVWIMIIAPPSSGKTKLLKILSGLKNYHELFTLTPRFLFSGHPNAGGGFMSRVVKEKGIIAFPDFTTVLKLNSKARNEIFNQFRVIFDGKAGLGTGIDSNTPNVWEGKVVFIALVTESIEKIKETTSDLGERFLYYKFYPSEKSLLQINSLATDNTLVTEIPLLVKKFLQTKRGELNEVIILDSDKEILYHFSKFISVGRATVERSGYRREIEIIHTPEQPFRVLNLLESFYKTLLTVNGDKKRTINIIKRIAVSSIPQIRLRIIINLSKSKKEGLSFEEIYSKLSKLSESKVRRTIGDMVAQDILSEISSKKGNKIFYSINKKFNTYWEKISKEK